MAAGLPASALLGGPSFPTTVADRVDKRYTAPGPRPAGIKATLDGIWVSDAETSKVYLMQYGSGAVKREVDIPASGLTCLTVDAIGIFVGADNGRRIIRMELEPKEKIPDEPQEYVKKAEWDTPGAGEVKWRNGAVVETMGVQGFIWRRGELFLAVPPAAAIHVFRPQDSSVVRTLQAPGIRPLGLAWDPDGNFWCADGNSRSFFKMDPISGKIIKQHMLPFNAPEEGGKIVVPYGLTIWQRMLYFCSPENGSIYRTPLVNRMS